MLDEHVKLSIIMKSHQEGYIEINNSNPLLRYVYLVPLVKFGQIWSHRGNKESILSISVYVCACVAPTCPFGLSRLEAALYCSQCIYKYIPRFVRFWVSVVVGVSSLFLSLPLFLMLSSSRLVPGIVWFKPRPAQVDQRGSTTLPPSLPGSRPPLCVGCLFY